MHLSTGIAYDPNSVIWSRGEKSQPKILTLLFLYDCASSKFDTANHSKMLTEKSPIQNSSGQCGEEKTSYFGHSTLIITYCAAINLLLFIYYFKRSKNIRYRTGTKKKIQNITQKKTITHQFYYRYLLDVSCGRVYPADLLKHKNSIVRFLL